MKYYIYTYFFLQKKKQCNLEYEVFVTKILWLKDLLWRMNKKYKHKY